MYSNTEVSCRRVDGRQSATVGSSLLSTMEVPVHGQFRSVRLSPEKSTAQLISDPLDWVGPAVFRTSNKQASAILVVHGGSIQEEHIRHFADPDCEMTHVQLVNE